MLATGKDIELREDRTYTICRAEGVGRVSRQANHNNRNDLDVCQVHLLRTPGGFSFNSQVGQCAGKMSIKVVVEHVRETAHRQA